MTPMLQTDPTITAINAAIVQGRAGNTTGARAALDGIWQRIGVDGDPLHRCWLAHSFADVHDDPAQALAWDVRAFDAAEALRRRGVDEICGLSLAGFYPSLHLNLADGYRRLCSFDVAAQQVHEAEACAGALADDDYGTVIRSLIEREAGLIASGDTRPLTDIESSVAP